jgi:hypothetical protein
MHRIAIVVLLTIFTRSLYADCDDSGLWVFPRNTEISSNSYFLLTGFSASQMIIESLNSKYPVYLVADDHRVSLNVVKTNKGMYELTQALLHPTRELIVGKTYYLKIDSLDAWSQTLLTDICWTVSDKKDLIQPEWEKEPIISSEIVELYGCGPEVYVIFDLSVIDESKVLVNTELIDLETNESTKYFLTPNKESKLYIGQGMCAGAFSLEKISQCKVRFELWDLSGNKTEMWTNWIEFESPYDLPVIKE